MGPLLPPNSRSGLASPVFIVWWRALISIGCTLLSESASRVVTSTGHHPNISDVILPFSILLLFPFAKISAIQPIMGLFSRKTKDVHVHIYQPTVSTLSPSVPLITQANPSLKPAPRLPACRMCCSSQRTQLATTQQGLHKGRQYYVCIGCPAPEASRGRSWIVWADQITV